VALANESILLSDSLAIHEAFKQGNVAALRKALDNPPDFPNCSGPQTIGYVLEYAIYHSPLAFIRSLLEHGADPNYTDHAGFPSLLAALSCPERPDSQEIMELLLAHGTDIQQRGVNDYTPLHYAAAANDVKMIEWLMGHGADPNAKTHIDEYATPFEEAEILGYLEAVKALRSFQGKSRIKN